MVVFTVYTPYPKQNAELYANNSMCILLPWCTIFVACILNVLYHALVLIFLPSRQVTGFKLYTELFVLANMVNVYYSTPKILIRQKVLDKSLFQLKYPFI